MSINQVLENYNKKLIKNLIQLMIIVVMIKFLKVQVKKLVLYSKILNYNED